jgi:HK97 family phage portal protein
VSLLRRGIEARAAANTFTQSYNPLNTLYGQTSLWSSAGERVDEITAMGVASVMSCVTLLSDSVSSMPLRATRLQPDGTRVPIPLPSVLADPDPGVSNTIELISQAMISLALHGNFYGLLAFGPDGFTPVGITPLHPYQMNVMANKDGSGRSYLHLGHPIPTDQMVHIRAYSSPQSLVGISPLLQQRTVMGLALATDRYLAQWYGEGATPSGVLESDRPVTTEQARLLRETWEGTHRKHRRPAILSDGLKWRQVTTSAVDMDFNNTADAIRAEVARIFRIPPHLMNIKGDGQTYSNVEQGSINFLTYTLQPWLVRLETAFSLQLIPDPDVEVRFDPSSLLRLDALTSANVDKLRISTGTRTPNEARTRDGLEPYPDGDAFTQVFQGASVDPAPVGTAVNG